MYLFFITNIFTTSYISDESINLSIVNAENPIVEFNKEQSNHDSNQKNTFNSKNDAVDDIRENQTLEDRPQLNFFKTSTFEDRIVYYEIILLLIESIAPYSSEYGQSVIKFLKTEKFLTQDPNYRSYANEFLKDCSNFLRMIFLTRYKTESITLELKLMVQKLNEKEKEVLEMFKKNV